MRKLKSNPNILSREILKVGFNKIIAQLEHQQKKGVDEAHKNIERLRELGKNRI